MDFPTYENPTAYHAQAVLDNTDLKAVSVAPNFTGVASGCAVSANATMGVAIASGTILINGAPYTTVGGTSAVSSASVGDRRDIVYATWSGSAVVFTTAAGTPATAGWTFGTQGTPPIKPTLPDNAVLLAEVYVVGTGATPTTVITSAEIVDKRCFVTQFTNDVTATTGGSMTLKAVGTAGTYGGGNALPSITTDSAGRISAANNIAAIPSTYTAGTPTYIGSATTPITGGTFTSGSWTFNASITPTACSSTANLITFSVSATTGFVVGQMITAAGFANAAYNGVFYVGAVSASAVTVYAGTNPASIPSNTTGKLYPTIGVGSQVGVAAVNGSATIPIGGITTNGTTWTVTTSAAHGFVNGASVTIAGVTPSGYNGSFTIASIGSTTFTITNATQPVPVTVAGTATATMGAISFAPVIASSLGSFTITTQPNGITPVNSPASGTLTYPVPLYSAASPAVGYYQAWSGTSPVQVPTFGGGKNALINSAMDIWNRGTSIAINTSIGASASAWTADRWYVTALNGSVTASQDGTATMPNNAPYGHRITTGSAGNAGYIMQQALDSVTSKALAGQNLTVSFNARFNANNNRTAVSIFTSSISNSITGNTWNHLSTASANTPTTYATTLPLQAVSGIIPTGTLGVMVQITPVAAINSIANSGTTPNIVWTVTTGTVHGLTTGDTVVIFAANASYNGTWTVASVPSGTTFTIGSQTTNPGTATGYATAAFSPVMSVSAFQITSATVFTYTAALPAASGGSSPSTYFQPGQTVTIAGLTGGAAVGNGTFVLASASASGFTVTTSGQTAGSLISGQAGTATAVTTHDVTKVQLEFMGGNNIYSIYNRHGGANETAEIITNGPAGTNGVLVTTGALDSGTGQGTPSWLTVGATNTALMSSGTQSVFAYRQTQALAYTTSGGVIGTNVGETIPVWGANAVYTTVASNMRLTAVYLTAGQQVTNLTFFGIGAGSGLSTAWGGLFTLASGSGSSGVTTLVAATATQSISTTSATAFATWALSSPYTVPSTGLYYVGFLFAGTSPTFPTLAGASSQISAVLNTPRPSAQITTAPATPPAIGATYNVGGSAWSIYAALT